MHVKFVDVEYFDTYDLELVAGRVYQQSDTIREYVVNEAFLEKEPPTPTWCIENGKWPYHSAEWEEWLKGKLGGANLPPPPLR